MAMCDSVSIFAPDATEDRATHQGACSAMAAPAVHVQLLPRQHPAAAVIRQFANCAVCGDAAVNDGQVQKV